MPKKKTSKKVTASRGGGNRRSDSRRGSTSKRSPESGRASAPPPQVVNRLEITCDRCGHKNTFRQMEGMRDVGVYRQAHARCKNCGRIAKIRDHAIRTS